MQVMKKLLPFSVLILAACEQPAATENAPQARQTANYAAQSVDSYVRGYAKYEQCVWGQGICAVAVTEASTTSTGTLSERTPRVRLQLRGNKLDAQFLTPFDSTVKVVTIRPNEEFFIAQPETEALGAKAIKVKQGTYRIERAWGEHGGVRLNVQLY
ncbi:hypothetical protein GCM10027346_30640 [Hymenobacter seoulensis]